MGKEYARIDESLTRWIERQQLFFVATAPLQPDGLVNCSPKGRDTLRVTGPRELAYLDLPGSGIETVAHVRENGRIVIMLCAFEGPPKIVRFHGRATVIEPGVSEFRALRRLFPAQPTEPRAFIRVSVKRIADSCGYGVPLYTFDADRRSLENYIANHTEQERHAYLGAANRLSLDGLPGLEYKE